MTSTKPRRAWPGLVLTLLGGCLDPELHVELEVPASLYPHISRASLQVVVPPTQSPFDCDAVAFAEVDPETLLLSLQQEVTVDGSASARLSAIDRRARKLLIAQAWSADGQRVAAGCRELAEVTTSQTVRIEAEPCPGVEIVEAQEQQEQLPKRVRLVLAGIDTEPLPGISTRWRLVSADSSVARGHDRSDAEGRILLTLPEAATVGPASLRLVARWQHAAPLDFVGFAAPKVVSLETAGAMHPVHDLALAAGRFVDNGSVNVAASIPCSGAPEQPCLSLLRYDASSDALSAQEYDLPSAEHALEESQPFVVLRGEQQDSLYTASLDQLSWLQPGVGWQNVRLAPALMDLEPGAFMLSVGACTGLSQDIRFMFKPSNGAAVYDVQGRQVSLPWAEQAIVNEGMLASGCVQAEQGLQRVLVTQNPSSGALTFHSEQATPLAAPIGLATPLSFVASDTLAAQLLATRIGGTALKISVLELSGAAESQRLVEVDSFSYGWFPGSLHGADLNGDGQLDIAGRVRSGSDALGWMAGIVLGNSGFSERLFGALTISNAEQTPSMTFADLDADGIDDLIALEPGFSEVPPDASSSGKLKLFLMGARAD